MKFTDGQWLLRPGVTAHYATEVRSITSEDGQLVIETPVRAIRDRGDTLQGPLLKVTLSSPMRDVIRVRIEHFAGSVPWSQIPIFPRGNVSPEIVESADFAIIKSEELAARSKKKTWALTFEAGGRVLTTSGWRAIAYMQTANWGNYVVSLGVGEHVYGLGERFTAFVKTARWSRL
jgi:alpha-D-xyloside xylohydrolase